MEFKIPRRNLWDRSIPVRLLGNKTHFTIILNSYSEFENKIWKITMTNFIMFALSDTIYFPHSPQKLFFLSVLLRNDSTSLIYSFDLHSLGSPVSCAFRTTKPSLQSKRRTFTQHSEVPIFLNNLTFFLNSLP